MATLNLTISEAEAFIKDFGYPQFSINIIQNTELVKSPFPELKEFVLKWQYTARMDRKIEMIKDLRSYLERRGFSTMSLAEAKWFIDKMFFGVNYPS